MRALVRRPCPSVRTSSSTSPCQSRTSRGDVGAEPRRPAWRGRGARPAAGRRRAAGARRGPSRTPRSRRWRAAARRPRVCSASPRPSAGGGSPLMAAVSLVAPLRDGRLHLCGRTHRCRRTPASGRAPRRAAGCRRSCRASTRRCASANDSSTALRSDTRCVVLVAARDDQLGGAPGRASRRAPRRVCPTTIDAGAGVAGQRLEPRAAARSTASGGSRPSASSVVSGTVKIGAVGSPCSRSIAARWGRISATASGGTRSSTMATRGAPVGGGAQQVPRHGIGVARRGGDEEPQVGGGEQLGRRWRGWPRRRSRCRGRRAGPCPAGSAVDSTRRTVPGCALAGLLAGDPARARAGCARRRTSAGRRGGARAPASVVVGRSTPGAADLGADHRVDQGRLARTGGAADDREQRGVDGAQPRQHVVVELLRASWRREASAGARLVTSSGSLAPSTASRRPSTAETSASTSSSTVTAPA